MVPHLQVEDALHQALGVTEPTLVVRSLADGRKGEEPAVPYTPIDITVDELFRRLRGQSLPALWMPRKENFSPIEALSTLGSGKLDLKRIKERAKQLAESAAQVAGLKAV